MSFEDNSILVAIGYEVKTKNSKFAGLSLQSGQISVSKYEKWSKLESSTSQSRLNRRMSAPALGLMAGFFVRTIHEQALDPGDLVFCMGGPADIEIKVML